MADDDGPQIQQTAQQTREVAAWAAPAYERTWRDYCAAGARYGQDYDGMMRWVSEQVQTQRAAYERVQRRPAWWHSLRRWAWQHNNLSTAHVESEA